MVQIKKTALRQNILMAARKEFIQKGFRGASMRSIAMKAGCSLSNLYNYFNNKDDLFTKVLEPTLNEIKKALQAVKEIKLTEGEYITSLEEERKCHRIVIDYIENHRDDIKLILLKSSGSSIESFPEYLVEKYQEMFVNYLDYLKKNFPKKIERGISDFFIHTVSSAYLNIVVEFLTHDIPHDEMVKYMDEMTKYSYNGFIGLLEG